SHHVRLVQGATSAGALVLDSHVREHDLNRARPWEGLCSNSPHARPTMAAFHSTLSGTSRLGSNMTCKTRDEGPQARHVALLCIGTILDRSVWRSDDGCRGVELLFDELLAKQIVSLYVGCPLELRPNGEM